METSKKQLKVIPIVAIVTLLMVVSIPSAFANSPSYGGGTFVTGNDATLSLGPIPNTGVLSQGQQIQVVDQDPNVGPAIVIAGGSCPIVLADYANLLGGSDVWELQDGAGNPIGYDVGPANGDTASVTFGPSGTSGTATTTGNAQLYIVTFGPLTFTPTPDGQYTWVNLQGGNAPNTARLGNWYGGTCGQDNPATGGILYKIPGAFSIEAPVGGSILPIDATSLVLAGMFTNGLWLLSTIGVASAIGIGFYKLRKY